MANSQYDGLSRDVWSMARVAGAAIPHLRSAIVFCVGVYGAEYDISIIKDSAADLNSWPLKIGSESHRRKRITRF